MEFRVWKAGEEGGRLLHSVIKLQRIFGRTTTGLKTRRRRRIINRRRRFKDEKMIYHVLIFLICIIMTKVLSNDCVKRETYECTRTKATRCPWSHSNDGQMMTTWWSSNGHKVDKKLKILNDQCCNFHVFSECSD